MQTAKILHMPAFAGTGRDLTLPFAPRVYPDGLVRQRSGYDAVLEARPLLNRLAAAHGQTGMIQDLPYFLAKPGLMRRVPHLITLIAPGDQTTRDTGQDEAVEAALLIHEFRPFGLPTGAFAVADRSGRSVLLGPERGSLRLAIAAVQHLFRSGANVAMLTVRTELLPRAAEASMRSGHPLGCQWAMRSRSNAAFLPLAATLDATLARLGQKTRSNLRYYRRRAEGELGARFVPNAAVTLPELLAFNRECMFPQTDRIVRWRRQALAELRRPFLVGLRDRNDRLLSLIGGRRFGSSSEILWQMNRAGLPRHSLVAAMRNCLLEHEIARGTDRLYIEGGTPHSLQHSFQHEDVTDMIFVRSRLRQAVQRFSTRYVPRDNMLSEMLGDPETVWHHA